MRTERGDLRAAAVIRDSAMQLFAERGPAVVTIREIAAAAGVSAGLVMHHYGSKDGLKDAVDSRAAAFFEEMLGELGRASDEGSGASLAGLLAARLEDVPVLVEYVRRLLLDGGAAADELFGKLLETTETGMRALVDAEVIRPAPDERTRTAFLLANDLSLLLLRRQIAQATGTDPLSAGGLATWTATVMDVYAGGIFTTAPDPAAASAPVKHSGQAAPEGARTARPGWEKQRR